MLWGRSLVANGDYIVNGIAISQDRLFVVAHAFSLTYDSIFFVVKSGGISNFV